MENSIKPDEHYYENKNQGDKKFFKTIGSYPLRPKTTDAGKYEDSGDYDCKTDGGVPEKKDVFFYKKKFEKHKTCAHR